MFWQSWNKMILNTKFLPGWTINCHRKIKDILGFSQRHLPPQGHPQQSKDHGNSALTVAVHNHLPWCAHFTPRRDPRPSQHALLTQKPLPIHFHPKQDSIIGSFNFQRSLKYLFPQSHPISIRLLTKLYYSKNIDLSPLRKHRRTPLVAQL